MGVVLVVLRVGLRIGEVVAGPTGAPETVAARMVGVAALPGKSAVGLVVDEEDVAELVVGIALDVALLGLTVSVLLRRAIGANPSGNSIGSIPCSRPVAWVRR